MGNRAGRQTEEPTSTTVQQEVQVPASSAAPVTQPSVYVGSIGNISGSHNPTIVGSSGVNIHHKAKPEVPVIQHTVPSVHVGSIGGISGHHNPTIVGSSGVNIQHNAKSEVPVTQPTAPNVHVGRIGEISGSHNPTIVGSSGVNIQHNVYSEGQGESRPEQALGGDQPMQQKQKVQELETKERGSRQEVISDSTLRTLAGKLGSEWEQLATYLGFGNHDIYKLKNDNPNSTNNQIFQMLVKWRDEQYLEEQVDLLRKELRKAEKGDIADKLQDIEDQSLQMLSKELRAAWRSLISSLNVEIQTSDTIEDTFQMLVKWRERQLSQEVQVSKLCTELKRVKKEELADEVRGTKS